MTERSLHDEARITGLTAVVTGAASPRGIGRGVALRLAAEGRPVALLDMDQEGLVEVAEKVRATGTGTVVTAEADIADADSVHAALSAVEAMAPPVGTLVNCAGIANPTPFLELTGEEFQRTLTINTTGAFHLCQRVLPAMLEQQLGRIVTISSTAGQDGGGNFSKSAYAASKAGAEGLIRGLAKEVSGTGVTANAVSPANIDTDIMGGPLLGQRREEFIGRTPVGRLGTVEELAELVAFLTGPSGGFITGATYNINGGLRIG